MLGIHLEEVDSPGPGVHRPETIDLLYPPEATLLLLSPHADDLALSVGGRLLSAAGWARTPKVFVTLFTTSVHAPYAAARGPSSITAVRAAEDYRYAAEHAAEITRFPFGEAMTRGYPSIASLFECRDPRQDPLYAESRDALRDLLGSRRFGAVVAPLGVGGHIEHLVVREICVELRVSPLLLYEDLPYAADEDDEALDRLSGFDGARRTADVLDCHDVAERKLEMVERCYPSQFSARERGRLEVYGRRRRVARERLRPPEGADEGIGPPEVLWATPADWEAYQRNLRVCEKPSRAKGGRVPPERRNRSVC